MDWEILVCHMRELGIDPEATVTRKSTWWFPTLPICFGIAAAEHCDTFDLDRHLNRATDEENAAGSTRSSGEDRPGDRALADVQSDHDRLCAAPLEALLSLGKIEYHAPTDAANTGLAADTVDVVYSNSVPEHVPGETILRLMQESRRDCRAVYRSTASTAGITTPILTAASRRSTTSPMRRSSGSFGTTTCSTRTACAPTSSSLPNKPGLRSSCASISPAKICWRHCRT